MSLFDPFEALDPFGLARSGGAYVTVPVALVDGDGAVFVNADSEILTYGTARVRPQLPWILDDGAWNDDGQWVDDAVWSEDA